MLVHFLILVFGLNLHAVAAFSSGLVNRACMDMTPGHRNNTASMLDPPYTVTTDISNYTEGQMITVTLQANATGFRGFLLQARAQTDPVGTFTIIGNDSQLLNCTTPGSAVSHNSNVTKTTIVAQWKAPMMNNADIRFRATFVQNFSVFWVGVQSDTVRFVGINPTAAPPPGTTTGTTTGTTAGTTTGTTAGTTTGTTTGTTAGTTTDASSPPLSLTMCLLLLPLLAIM
ncbi:putative defense protein [Garra rufa]|uniref:putative defense protein n=1 Tax=Garra rufa TaxID=137080 RepID=UPI003CCE6500